MIEVKGLTKNYGSNRGIKNLSFKVEKGEILGLLGSNGAGKTTTMNLLTGYKTPTSGQITVDGISFLEKPMKVKRKIGNHPQIPQHYPKLKVLAYLRFACNLKGVPSKDREERIKKVMALVNISNVQNRLIKNLSKGYRQRLGLAQALIANPDVLILDEPTVGLDPKQIHEMRSLIKSLGKEHTVILSSHILAEVSMICDRVVILKNGEILSEINKIQGVLNIEKHIYEAECEYAEFIIESSKTVDVKTPLFFKMASLGYAINEMRPVSASLEDVFMQLTNETKSNEEDIG